MADFGELIADSAVLPCRSLCQSSLPLSRLVVEEDDELKKQPALYATTSTAPLMSV